MASNMKVRKCRVKMKNLKKGLDRKKLIAREGSTPTKEQFFGDKSDD